MGKDIAESRGYPLFMYGQRYMLVSQRVSSPYVIHTLEAAIWTFERTSHFT